MAAIGWVLICTKEERYEGKERVGAHSVLQAKALAVTAR